MSVRRLVVPMLATTLVLGACRSDPPPPPEPPMEENDDAAERERQRQAAEEARRQAMLEEQRQREMEEARQRRVADARATLEEMIFFDYDQSDLRPEAQTLLRQKVDILRASPQVQLRIEGHADERGSTEYNIALGNRRAEAVRQFLTGFGLSPARFSIVSYGEERPLVNASNEAAWARNRRAAFAITAGANAINVPN